MSQTIIRTGVSTSTNIASAATALATNETRISYKIQNLGTNALFVNEGSAASVTVFSYILAAGAGNDDGSGASYESVSGQCYPGIVTIAGTAPRYVIIERTQQ